MLDQSIHFAWQVVGPHAPDADGTTNSSTSSSDDSGDSEGETGVTTKHPSNTSAAGDGLAAEACGDLDPAAAVTAIEDSVTPGEDPATSPEGDSAGSDSTDPSHAGAGLATTSNTAIADCKNDRKRKHGSGPGLAHGDGVVTHRLKTLPRSKAQAANKVPKTHTEGSPGFASPLSMLSPMKDASKKKITPRKARVPKKPQSLESRMSATVLSEGQVVELIAELFEEQEQDDRDMYNILTQTVKEQTQCERSDVVEEMDQMEFRRMLTYGEVSVESVSSRILPFLKLQPDDVFYDLGCGSGKILIQAMLQTPCSVAKGIELMQNRVQQGNDALERLLEKNLPVMEGKSVDIVQGDICKPPKSAPMMDATVVFINNVCFSPELMLRVTQMLTKIPNLRRVVTLRRFCVRHRAQRCVKARSHCVEYVHPPEEAEISVSWASKTSAYLYERIEYSVQQLTAQLQS